MLKRLLTMALLVLAIPLLAQTESAEFTSTRGLFTVSYESQLQPIAINRIHSWILHVSDADGNPVSGATMTVKGGMPQHNHGLATEPTIEATGNGDYLLQGLRFHMMGYWELELAIDAGSVSDTVVIPLEL